MQNKTKFPTRNHLSCKRSSNLLTLHKRCHKHFEMVVFFSSFQILILSLSRPQGENVGGCMCDSFKCVVSSIAEGLPKIWISVCFDNQLFLAMFWAKQNVGQRRRTRTTMFCRFSIMFSWPLNRQHAIWKPPGEGNQFRWDYFSPCAESTCINADIFHASGSGSSAPKTLEKLLENLAPFNFWMWPFCWRKLRLRMSETPRSDNIATVRTPNLHNPCKWKQPKPSANQWQPKWQTHIWLTSLILCKFLDRPSWQRIGWF